MPVGGDCHGAFPDVNCAEYLDLVAADVDGVLGAASEAARRHLEVCPACRAERERQRAVRALVSSRAMPDVPVGFRGRIRAAIDEEARRLEHAKPRFAILRRRRWIVVPALAAALAAFIVLRDRSSPFGPLIREYDRAAEGTLTLEVATGATDELENFYRTHAADGVPAHVVDLSRAGFRLVGGALASFPDRRARERSTT